MIFLLSCNCTLHSWTEPSHSSLSSLYEYSTYQYLVPAT